MTSSLFEDLGCSTVYRKPPSSAETAGGRRQIDLAFSDIVMPGTIDGVGLASGSSRNIPICGDPHHRYSDPRALHRRIFASCGAFDSNTQGFVREAMEIPMILSGFIRPWRRRR